MTVEPGGHRGSPRHTWASERVEPGDPFGADAERRVEQHDLPAGRVALRGVEADVARNVAAGRDLARAQQVVAAGEPVFEMVPFGSCSFESIKLPRGRVGVAAASAAALLPTQQPMTRSLRRRAVPGGSTPDGARPPRVRGRAPSAEQMFLLRDGTHVRPGHGGLGHVNCGEDGAQRQSTRQLHQLGGQRGPLPVADPGVEHGSRCHVHGRTQHVADQLSRLRLGGHDGTRSAAGPLNAGKAGRPAATGRTLCALQPGGTQHSFRAGPALQTLEALLALLTERPYRALGALVALVPGLSGSTGAGRRGADMIEILTCTAEPGLPGR